MPEILPWTLSCKCRFNPLNPPSCGVINIPPAKVNLATTFCPYSLVRPFPYCFDGAPTAFPPQELLNPPSTAFDEPTKLAAPVLSYQWMTAVSGLCETEDPQPSAPHTPSPPPPFPFSRSSPAYNVRDLWALFPFSGETPTFVSRALRYSCRLSPSFVGPCLHL